MTEPSTGTPSARQERILLALCRQYVSSGRPVASGLLCRAHGLEWSPATVRNELAALERAGLVHKPHAASGRVPTAQGWQVYVEHLPRCAARPEHQRLLDMSLAESIDPRLGLRSTARVLSEIAGCVAIGFLADPRLSVVRAVELVPLAHGDEERSRVLVMLGLDDGASSVCTVDLEREIVEGEGVLRRLQGLLRELTVGRNLGEAREHLRQLIEAQEQRVDGLLHEALRVGLLLCAMSFDPLWMQVAGQRSLLGAAGPSGEGEAPAQILALLEDYQRLAEILCQLLPEPEPEPRASVQVDVGDSKLLSVGALPVPLVSHHGVRALSGLSLVGCRLGWPSPRSAGATTTGAVALLGSPRMDYEAVIPLVEYAARAMAARP